MGHPATPGRPSARRPARVGFAIGVMVLLAGCVGQRPGGAPAAAPDPRWAAIDDAIPRRTPDRAGWTRDILGAFTSLDLDTSRENVCAVVAIIEQESGFVVDPLVPDLPAIAWREIDARAAGAGVPRVMVHGVLGLPSRGGRSYGERIDHVRTERDLSDIFEDFIAAVPLGQTLFADRNPIRTRGPMQVHVAFAQEYARQRPYPYPVKTSLSDEVFTRRGGVYFGVAHLLDYRAPYDKPLYRFADFNAGRYASRNAAFQAAVGTLSGSAIVNDGALIPHDEAALGQTEAALHAVDGRLHLDESAIHESLRGSRSAAFGDSELYRRVFALAEIQARHPLPRALLPHIELHGPKITRHLTTAWYARRVDGRFQRCLRR